MKKKNFSVAAKLPDLTLSSPMCFPSKSHTRIGGTFTFLLEILDMLRRLCDCTEFASSGISSSRFTEVVHQAGEEVLECIGNQNCQTHQCHEVR